MPKFLIISILLSPIFWACACASTDSCAEEWYEESREENQKKNAMCVDQLKYDECIEYHRGIPLSPDISVSSYCYDQAKYRCKDRKSSSSKKKW